VNQGSLNELRGNITSLIENKLLEYKSLLSWNDGKLALTGNEERYVEVRQVPMP
jgi:hypothetical protein